MSNERKDEDQSVESIESLNEEPLDAGEMTPEDLENVSGGDEDTTGCGNNSCWWYSEN